jgi:hypothetical protein
MAARIMAIASALILLGYGPTEAQLAWTAPTGQANNWKPIIYSDLSSRTANSDVYQELWSKEIAANNQTYVQKGDFRWSDGNAPAFEAHFVVRSPSKTVILSVLDTGSGCTNNRDHPASAEIVKFCPLLIAVYQGATVTVTRGRKGCFLEIGPSGRSGDPSDSVSYAAYDKEHRAIKVGTIVNHRPVSGCSATIRLN